MKLRRQFVLVSGLLLLANIALAAEQSYMGQIAQRTCDCVGKIPADKLSANSSVQLGVCMIQSITKEDKVKLKQDHGLDPEKLLENGAQLGALVGEKMVFVCPSVFMGIFAGEQETALDDDSAWLEASGVISKIEHTPFVEITIAELDETTSKFIWLTEVDSDVDDLTKHYSELKGRSVKVVYEERNLFDAKLAKYRRYKVLKSIEKN